MKIKFSKDVELTHWYRHGRLPDIMWCKYLATNSDDDPEILVSVRANMSDKTKCYANFYSKLKYLHNHFPEFINGDLDFAKEYVDNFIIKISGLIVFV